MLINPEYLSTLVELQFLFPRICLGYLSILIYFGFYQHWYASKLYQLDMSWIFIILIWVGHLFTRICLQNLSTLICLQIYQLDITPNYIKLICIGYLFTRIRLEYLSTWYVLDIYSCWYEMDIYFHEYASKSIDTDRTPISINMICLGYLSTLI